MPPKAGFRDFLAHAHLIVGREAPADHAARRSGHLNPIVHIVLFEDARGTEEVLRDEAHHVLDFRGRRFIDDGPAPNLHLIWPPWMPNTNSAGEPVKRKVGKNRSCGGRYLARASNPQAAFNFRGVFFHIVDQLDDGLRKPWTCIIGRTYPGHQNVTVATRNLAALVPFSCLARRRIDTQFASGTVSTGDVIAVAAKVF